MRSVISLWLLVVFPQLAWSQQLTLPLVRDSLRFAVIGDTGTGTTSQYQVGKTLIEYRSKFPYEFVLMLGDNLYGNEDAKDFEKKFERPYRPLLDAGIRFYAALGNHDDPNQRFYKLFNMSGERYYSFRPKAGVRFFALDSNYMDKKQLEWLDKELSGSVSDWKICFFHHPLYSSGEKHGPAVELRKILEPVLLKHNVSVVFAGHEHFYERLKPQKGIYHFTQGGSAKLREGNLAKTDLTAKGFDQDNSFMLVEIAADQLYFQTISRTGKTVDSGVIRRINEPVKKDS
jgi:Calcineurin-like phosphoesterase